MDKYDIANKIEDALRADPEIREAFFGDDREESQEVVATGKNGERFSIVVRGLEE